MERDSRTYTRKQIEEALKYWTKRLDVLNESITRTIQALIDEFGEKRVISREKDYRLTKEDLQKIYDVLNRCLFDGKLGKIRLEYWPERLIVEQMNDHVLRSGCFDKKYDDAPFYGICSGVCEDVCDKDGNIVAVHMHDDVIMINKTLLGDCVFVFVVATICHEMIHYADRYTEEHYGKVLYSSQHGNRPFNPHKDRVFQEKMELARKEGINVVERIEANETHDSVNKDAAALLKSVLDEDDDGAIVSANDRTAVIRGPGSHTFCIIDCD